MANYSKLVVIGYVVRDPAQRSLPNGESVAEFTVPYTERKRDQDGVWSDGATAWYCVSAFGGLAERVAEHLHKGTHVYIEGTLAPREYTDREGQTRTSLDVRARDIRVLDKRPESGPSPEEGPAQTSGADDQDYPF